MSQGVGLQPHWREALSAWRQTGDVSGLAEIVAGTPPTQRRELMGMILPCALRHDVEALLECEQAGLCAEV